MTHSTLEHAVIVPWQFRSIKTCFQQMFRSFETFSEVGRSWKRPRLDHPAYIIHAADVEDELVVPYFIFFLLLRVTLAWCGS